jgi:hypothetical protein
LSFKIGDRVKVTKNPSFNKGITGWVGIVVPIPKNVFEEDREFFVIHDSIAVIWNSEYDTERVYYFTIMDQECLELLLSTKELI